MSTATPSVRRLDLKVGFSCNNRCRFCVQGDKRDRHQDKTTAELRVALEEGREHADELVLTGGEVTIRRDLPELVSYARELGYRVIQLQTNGRLLSVQRALDRLIEAGVTEFSPAIHGPNAATHDALTGSPGAFRQTVRGVRNVKRAGLPVIINSVIVKANYTYLEEMARLFIALAVDQFQFAFVHALGSAGAHFDEVMPRVSRVQPHLIRALAIARAAGVKAYSEGVPLCLLPGYERHAAEWYIPRTRIVDAELVVPDYTRARREEAKLQGPACVNCRWQAQCEGPWREYPEAFGWDEFIPVQPAE